MKNLILLLLIPFSVPALAQYYYKDLVSAVGISRTMKSYITNKVSSVTAAGYDPQGNKTDDFSEQRQILGQGTILRTITRHGNDVSFSSSRFDDQTRLLQTTDSVSGLSSSTTYTYNADGRITSLKNNTIDPANEINTTETHYWYYTPAGLPEKMLQVVNGTDSTEYRFHTDENGNVTEEQSFKNGVEGEKIYYYYDDKNRMTDIVRYYERLNKLLPDFMFEYDDDNNVIQKLTTLSNQQLGYLIWRYAFNDRGLKSKEALYNKDKMMTGKIEYSYSFSQ